jgi:hypothetical protein
MQGRPDRAPGSASSLRFCGEWATLTVDGGCSSLGAATSLASVSLDHAG